jgi:hypothetical protein
LNRGGNVTHSMLWQYPTLLQGKIFALPANHSEVPANFENNNRLNITRSIQQHCSLLRLV